MVTITPAAFSPPTAEDAVYYKVLVTQTLGQRPLKNIIQYHQRFESEFSTFHLVLHSTILIPIHLDADPKVIWNYRH